MDQPRATFLIDDTEVTCELNDAEGFPIVSCNLGDLEVDQEATITLHTRLWWKVWDETEIIRNQVVVKAANTIAPFEDDTDAVEAPFKQLNELFDYELCAMEPCLFSTTEPDIENTSTVEAERLKQTGKELLEDGARLQDFAEAIQIQADGWRELAEQTREHAKHLPEGPLRDDRLKDAEQYDREADRLEEMADQEDAKAAQAAKDAEQKIQNAQQAEAEAQRLARERAEAERQAAEDEARRDRLEEEARIKAEQEERGTKRRAGEEVDRKKRESERQYQEAEKQRKKTQAAVADGQPAGNNEQTGNGGDVEEKGGGPGIGGVVKSTVRKGAGLVLEEGFDVPGVGKATAGLNKLGAIKQFGEAAQEVVDGMAQGNKKVGDLFDLLSDPKAKIDPRTVQGAQFDVFNEAAKKLVKDAPISTP